jgi:hypothetical protein
MTRLAARVRALPALVSPGPASPRRPAAGVLGGCVPCVAAAGRSGSDVMLCVCVVCVVHDFSFSTIADCRRYIVNLLCGEAIPLGGKFFSQGPGSGGRQGLAPEARNTYPGRAGGPGAAQVTKRRRPGRTGFGGGRPGAVVRRPGRARRDRPAARYCSPPAVRPGTGSGPGRLNAPDGQQPPPAR